MGDSPQQLPASAEWEWKILLGVRTKELGLNCLVPARHGLSSRSCAYMTVLS